MKQTDKICLSMAIALLIITATTSFESFYTQCSAITNDTLRLHIIANSDTPRDQQAKLIVRDEILSEYGDILGSCTNATQAANIAEALLPQIEKTAFTTLQNLGIDCEINAYVTNMFFTTRQYEQTMMPAGDYTALRIELGKGKGENWWCVMYPPLCIPVATKEDENRVWENINQLNSTPNLVPKLAIVEFIEKIRQGS